MNESILTVKRNLEAKGWKFWRDDYGFYNLESPDKKFSTHHSELRTAVERASDYDRIHTPQAPAPVDIATERIAELEAWQAGALVDFEQIQRKIKAILNETDDPIITALAKGIYLLTRNGEAEKQAPLAAPVQADAVTHVTTTLMVDDKVRAKDGKSGRMTVWSIVGNRCGVTYENGASSEADTWLIDDLVLDYRPSWNRNEA